MRTKPILFNTEMVQALLDGRKTVTRRVAFPNTDLRPFRENEWWFRGRVYRDWDTAMRAPQGVMSLCKYKPGDILWVRETWTKSIIGTFRYKADDKAIFETDWHPSIHMSKAAARIFLRVTGVRVEQLTQIRIKDCKAEGIRCFEIQGLPMFGLHKNDKVFSSYPAGRFADLWDSTVKPADREKYGWNANPWVWVIEFERCEKPEDWP